MIKKLNKIKEVADKATDDSVFIANSRQDVPKLVDALLHAIGGLNTIQVDTDMGGLCVDNFSKEELWEIIEDIQGFSNNSLYNIKSSL